MRVGSDLVMQAVLVGTCLRLSAHGTVAKNFQHISLFIRYNMVSL